MHAWHLSLRSCHGLQQNTAKQVLAGTQPLRTVTFHALLVEYLAAHQTTYSAPPAPANSIQLQLKNRVLHPPLSHELCVQLVSQAAVTLFGTTSACNARGWQLTRTAVPGWHAYIVTALANWPRPPQAIAGAALLQRAVDADGAIADAARVLLVLSVALARLEEYFLPPDIAMRAADALLSAPDTMVSAICFLRYQGKAARNALHTGNKAAVALKVARALAHGSNIYSAQAISSASFSRHLAREDLAQAFCQLTISTGTWTFLPAAEDTSAYACSALAGQLLKLEDSMGLPAASLACICKLSALQSLDVSKCEFITTDSARHVSNLVQLTALNVSGCNGLTAVPDDIGKLCALQTLDLSDSNRLQKLPDSIGTLSALQTLDLSGCYRLQMLPDSIGKLCALQTLDLSGCYRLQELPDSIGTLRALQTLNLSGCGRLRELPDSIGDLSVLQTLRLGGCCALRELPNTIGALRALQTLDLSDCHSLQELPDSMGTLRALQRLKLSYCDKLQKLPDSMGTLRALQRLKLSYCDKLQKLPDSMGTLRALQRLKLSYCDKLQKLPDSMGTLRALQRLKLSYCDKLQKLPDSMGTLRALQRLKLSYCDKLQKLPDSMGTLRALQRLKLSYCDKLQKLPDSMGTLRALQRLKLSYCDKLQKLPDSMGTLRALQRLKLSYCDKLQ